MSKEEKQGLQAQPDENQAGMDTFFADAPAPKQEAAKQGGMSRNTKTLIAGAAVLLLLGGGLAAVLLMQKGDGGEASLSSGTDSSPQSATEAAEMILLNPGTADTLTSVEISSEEKFTVYRKSEVTAEAGAVYSIKGMEKLPINANLLSTVVKNGSELSASQLVEEDAAELAKYGLADPISEVTMTYSDGTEFAFAVGDVSPMQADFTYVAVDGDVYLVKSSLMSNYQKTADFFVSSKVLEEPADEDYPIVESIRIEREDLDYDIYLEYAYDEKEDDSTGGTAATHIMLEPRRAYLSVDKSADVTNGMFGLTASEIVKLFPTEAELAEAGLDEPFCTVTMECDDGNTYHLYFGDLYTEEDGTESFYMYFEGTEILYGMAKETAIWAVMQPGDITSSIIFGTYVWNIATLDVKADTESFAFSGTGEDSNSYVVTKNGEACETERFRTFYHFLLSIYGEELYLGELPSGDPEIAIHLTTQDGAEDYTVDFYRLDDLNAVVAVNGVPSYKIRSSCLNTIKKNMEIFDTEEAFIMTWQ